MSEVTFQTLRQYKAHFGCLEEWSCGDKGDCFYHCCAAAQDVETWNTLDDDGRRRKMLKVMQEMSVWWRDHGPNHTLDNGTTLIRLLQLHEGDEVFKTTLAQHIVELRDNSLSADLAQGFDDYLSNLKDPGRQKILRTLYQENQSVQNVGDVGIEQQRMDMVQTMMLPPCCPSRAVAEGVWGFFLESLIEKDRYRDTVKLQAAAGVLQRTIRVVLVDEYGKLIQQPLIFSPLVESQVPSMHMVKRLFKVETPIQDSVVWKLMLTPKELAAAVCMCRNNEEVSHSSSASLESDLEQPAEQPATHPHRDSATSLPHVYQFQQATGHVNSPPLAALLNQASEYAVVATECSETQSQSSIMSTGSSRHVQHTFNHDGRSPGDLLRKAKTIFEKRVESGNAFHSLHVPPAEAVPQEDRHGATIVGRDAVTYDKEQGQPNPGGTQRLPVAKCEPTMIASADVTLQDVNTSQMQQETDPRFKPETLQESAMAQRGSTLSTFDTPRGLFPVANQQMNFSEASLIAPPQRPQTSGASDTMQLPSQKNVTPARNLLLGVSGKLVSCATKVINIITPSRPTATAPGWTVDNILDWILFILHSTVLLVLLGLMMVRLAHSMPPPFSTWFASRPSKASEMLSTSNIIAEIKELNSTDLSGNVETLAGSWGVQTHQTATSDLAPQQATSKGDEITATSLVQVTTNHTGVPVQSGAKDANYLTGAGWLTQHMTTFLVPVFKTVIITVAWQHELGRQVSSHTALIVVMSYTWGGDLQVTSFLGWCSMLLVVLYIKSQSLRRALSACRTCCVRIVSTLGGLGLHI